MDDHWIEEGGNSYILDNGKFKNIGLSTVIYGICLYNASQSDSVTFVRGLMGKGGVIYQCESVGTHRCINNVVTY